MAHLRDAHFGLRHLPPGSPATSFTHSPAPPTTPSHLYVVGARPLLPVFAYSFSHHASPRLFVSGRTPPRAESGRPPHIIRETPFGNIPLHFATRGIHTQMRAAPP